MSAIILFEEKQVRRAWSKNKQKWYFAIPDVIAVLTGSVDPRAYWRKLKERLKKEGNQTVTDCHGLKMTAADGRQRLRKLQKIVRKSDPALAKPGVSGLTSFLRPRQIMIEFGRIVRAFSAAVGQKFFECLPTHPGPFDRPPNGKQPPGIERQGQFFLQFSLETGL